MKKILCFLLSVLLFMLAFTACGSSKEQNDNTKTKLNASSETNVEHKKVKVTMENGGSFIIELYPEYAPETCGNFIDLVNKGFYNGLTFHRIVDGFMAQGGSSDGKGIAGSDKTIKGEFKANGFEQNTLSHTRGVISMARANSYNSASSQFFICYDDASFLDGGYAAFGKVVEGMEVVDDFCKVERVLNGTDNTPAKPVNPIVIAKMEVI